MSPNDKRKQTVLELYGVENVAHLAESQIKKKASNLLKYGVENVMQDPEIFQRCMNSQYRIKKYVAHCGTEFLYQGYEDVAIKFLLDDLEIESSKISAGKALMPRIFYNNPLTKKVSRYYPDIWVEHLNLLIEVKSSYTFKIKTEITLEKQRECKRQGYHHVILICSKHAILDLIL